MEAQRVGVQADPPGELGRIDRLAGGDERPEHAHAARIGEGAMAGWNF
jgi:hypothetical protein